MELISQIFIVSFAPSLFWLAYFLYTGRYGNRDALALLLVFFAGTAAAPLALGLFEILEAIPFYRGLTDVYSIDDDAVRFAYSMFAIGPVEELAKLLVVWVIFYRRAELRTPLDGLAFACAAGLGFASVENWYYMGEVQQVVWTRAITLPFNHMLFSSFWGVSLAYGKFAGPHSRSRVVFVAVVLAFVFHGLYDYILLSPGVPDALVLPLIAMLWVWLTISLRRLRSARTLDGALHIRRPAGVETPGRTGP